MPIGALFIMHRRLFGKCILLSLGDLSMIRYLSSLNVMGNPLKHRHRQTDKGQSNVVRTDI